MPATASAAYRLLFLGKDPESQELIDDDSIGDYYKDDYRNDNDLLDPTLEHASYETQG